MTEKVKTYTKVLGISTLVFSLILFLRNAFVDNTQYNFLFWNLFLGFIPFVTAALLSIYFERLNNMIVWLGIGFWLLFYPNAPYMITDLIHVSESQQVVYDTIIIFAFAMISAFAGFYSLGLVFSIIQQIKNQFWAYFTIITSILLSSFGIYLGRVLRLNSWDIFTKPLETFKLIFEHLFPITQNPVTYSMIVLFSLLQFMLLLMIVDMQKNRRM